MYGDPCPPPEGAIILRQHWQYRVKTDGTRRARNCGDGSKRAAPELYRLFATYSSCLEHPMFRLFIALSVQLCYVVYGGDAKDAFAHSPPPTVPIYVYIDDAYADWYKWRFNIELNRSDVLPVNHALQGLIPVILLLKLLAGYYIIAMRHVLWVISVFLHLIQYPIHDSHILDGEGVED